jgi:hypothetical protein
LIAAQRDYLAGVLEAIAAGRRVSDEESRSRSRRARLARTKAESTVATSLSEPAAHRLDPDWSQGVLAGARRLVQATHVLRLEVQEGGEHPPLEPLRPLAADIDSVLVLVQTRVESDDRSPQVIPELRARHGALERQLARDPWTLPIVGQLDEVVDAVNSLAALVGLGPEGSEEAPPRAAASQPTARRSRQARAGPS